MASEVLLVGGEGKPERLPISEALLRARAQELDLIEVAAKATPPVVRIGEFGHYLYQVQKKERRQRSRAKHSEVKTLRFGFRTEKHDIDRVLERAREFFLEHHIVKLVVRLRGRELTNTEYAKTKLRSVIDALLDTAEVDQEMKRQGNQFIVVLRPKH